MLISKKEIIHQLQKEILLLQSFKPPELQKAETFGLGTIETAFPNGIFPTGTIHEFLNEVPEHQAACGGFIASLLKVLMQQGNCIWIGTSRKLFPPALKAFGVDPERIIFVDLQREKDMLWATEEALKCEGLVAVVAEISDLSFTTSRRLQLAVEKSKVTGFILRNNPHQISATACAARWKITSLPSKSEDHMPGVGFPRWTVELLKVRNGNPGIWTMEWVIDAFAEVRETQAAIVLLNQKRKVG